MKTILITGGTDGIGKGIAKHLLENGDSVIVIGSSEEKGEQFLDELAETGAEHRAFFYQADLSLIEENKRIVREISTRFDYLDGIILSANTHSIRDNIVETEDGLEFGFALAYMSRFLLSYGFRNLLVKSENPIIINICAPGMKGTVDLEDIQNRTHYNGAKQKYHGSRLNDLLGVSFTENNIENNIKYVLFNPWAVRTKAIFESIHNPVSRGFTKFMFLLIGRDVYTATLPLLDLVTTPPESKLSAFIQKKKVDLSKATFDEENARELYLQTVKLLDNK